MGRELPDHPTVFSKLLRTLAEPTDTIDLPDASGQVDPIPGQPVQLGEPQPGVQG